MVTAQKPAMKVEMEVIRNGTMVDDNAMVSKSEDLDSSVFKFPIR